LLCFLILTQHACIKCEHLLSLQTGRFRQFWDEAAKSRHIVEAVPGSNQLC